MTESQVYTPHIRAVYKKLGSSLPLSVWVKSIGSKLPYFRNDSDIYSPITLHLKIAGSINNSDGGVCLNVVPSDSDWYSKLQSAVRDMTGTTSKVDIVDYLGDNISTFNFSQLFSAGELDVVHSRNQSVVRISSAVAPPQHMATNKMEIINDFVKNIREPISDTIAGELQGHTMAEIGRLTSRNGPLQSKIEATLAQRKGWSSFLTTYAMDNVSRSNDNKKQTSALAKSILYQVRQGLTANERQISDYHAANENKNSDEAPLWEQHAASVSSPYKDEYTMYKDIADDAMHSQLLSRKLVYIIHRGADRTTKKTQSAPISKRVTTSKNEGRHVMDQFYHDYYYKKHGKFPGHVIDKFNKRDNVGSVYPGNEDEAVNMFLMFSGKHTPTRNSTGKSMPKLVPINQKCTEGHTLVPISSQMPKLIPINQKCTEGHTLVPISSQMPKLIPIGQKIRSGKHKLVPIDAGMGDISREIDAEDFSEPVFEMPNLSKFIRKK